MSGDDKLIKKLVVGNNKLKQGGWIDRASFNLVEVRMSKENCTFEWLEEVIERRGARK